MNIITCIKQVPDTTEINIDRETGVLIRDNVPAILNPFDTYAIEEGLSIKEKTGGSVTSITMGPKAAIEVLYEALSMSVDNTIHICDGAFRGSDTYITAKILAKAIEKAGDYDLILCGKQAIDGDTAQIGPEIAEMLQIPHIAYIKKVLEVKDHSLVVERMVENGIEVIEIELPALLTVLKDINTPRLPSYRLKKKAKESVIPEWGLADLGLKEEEVGLSGSPTTVMKTYVPEIKSNCRILKGKPQEMVDELITSLEIS